MLEESLKALLLEHDVQEGTYTLVRYDRDAGITVKKRGTPAFILDDGDTVFHIFTEDFPLSQLAI